MNLVRQFGTARQEFLELLTRYDQRSDFFVATKYFEKVYAIHYEHKGWLQRILWYLYRALYGVVYVSYFHKAHWVLQHWGDNHVSASLVLGIVWFYSGVILRVAILEWHYPLLAQLRAFLNDHSYQREDPWTNEKRSHFYRRSNRITFAIMGLNFAEIVCYATTGVLKLDDFMLQYRGKAVGGWQLQVVYGVFTMFWGGTFCVSFLICYMLMSTFELEIVILLHSLERLGHSLRLKDLSYSSLMGSAEDELFWNGIIYKLRPHIQRLMDLFDNLQKLKAIINPFAFVQYYCTYLVIAICWLVLAVDGMPSYFIIIAMAMVVCLTDAFFLCRTVEKLRNLKLRIAEVLYDFDWTLQLYRSDRRFEAQYRHVQHTFVLITAHSAQMIQFSFAGIGEISMNSFAELLQKSYSMLMFLLQFAK